uniref:Uncharacterized protein n=1 Tax=Tanacetum cinerariifolium TaxID=118510 RepID=A0A699HDX4_TANCI|nr:hypothetical protein [Tanacetum cinerariifolium]
MGCGEAIDEILTIKFFVAGTNEEIFTSEGWTNAFNINEPIYSELFHEFYSAYEFDEVCAADELRTKKIIKFRLCGRVFSWTLLEFAKRLGLYNSEEIREEGFDMYFLARWMKRKGASSHKESMICYGQFITMISKRKNLLSEEVLNNLITLIYCSALDTNILRELIDSEGRLIPKAPEPVVYPSPLVLPSSSSSPPPSLLPSSSSPPPLPLSSSSCKRPRSPSPPPPPPSVPPPPPPPQERVESVRDDVETLYARLASTQQGTMTLHVRVESLNKYDVVTRDSLRIARVTDRLEILELRSRAEYVEIRLDRSHDRSTGMEFSLAEAR